MAASFTGAFPHRLLQHRPQHPHHHLVQTSAFTQHTSLDITTYNTGDNARMQKLGCHTHVWPGTCSTSTPQFYSLQSLTSVSRLNVKSLSAATAHAVSRSNYHISAHGLTVYTDGREDVITQRLHPWILHPSLVRTVPTPSSFSYQPHTTANQQYSRTTSTTYTSTNNS